MGGHVEFPNGAGAAAGYLATPSDGGAGPALIVLGPMLGLEANITSVCDRFAAEGFTALAPEVVAGGGTDQDRVVGVNLPVAIDGLRAAVGFFDDTRPEVFDADAAHEAFIRSLSFLRAHLG